MHSNVILHTKHLTTTYLQQAKRKRPHFCMVIITGHPKRTSKGIAIWCFYPKFSYSMRTSPENAFKTF